MRLKLDMIEKFFVTVSGARCPDFTRDVTLLADDVACQGKDKPYNQEIQ
jgi:hypothetical protein